MSSPPLPIITPPALRKGDTIAFLSPSSRLNKIFPLRIERARAFLESQGYKVVEIYSPLPSGREAAIAHRVDEIHRAFTDPTINAILPTLGGFNLNTLLPYIDYSLIRAHPKPLLGHSDLTLLHHAIYTRAGLRTFYGPSAIATFGEFPTPQPLSAGHLAHVLLEQQQQHQQQKPPGPLWRCDVWSQEFRDWAREQGEEGFLRARKTTPAAETGTGWKWIGRSGGKGGGGGGGEERRTRAQGVLFGGCLPSLVQLLGTPYTLPAAEWRGKVLLLETPEHPDHPGKRWPMLLAQQALGDLRNAGVLEAVAGIVVGRPKGYGGGGEGEVGEEWKMWEAMLEEELGGLGVPVLINVDVGHTDPVLTVPLGAECVLDSDKDLWEIVEPVVTRRV